VGHHQTSLGGAGAYDDLYVVIDIYPRSIVTWTVQAREDSEIAKTSTARQSDSHCKSELSRR